MVAGLPHTHCLSRGSPQRLAGLLNWPSPEPEVPNFVMKLPLLSNTCMRSLKCLPHTRCPLRGSRQRLMASINWPSPEPKVPNFVMKVPAAVKHLDSVVESVCHIHVARGGVHRNACWTIKLAVAGADSPKLCDEVPLLSNTWILLLPVSATYTLPVEGFTATPNGKLNWPSPEPRDPKFCDESAGAVKHLDAVVAGVCHIHVAC